MMHSDWHSHIGVRQPDSDWHVHVLDPRFPLAYVRGSKHNFHIMDDSEAQNEQNQVSQKNTPNESDGDTNENELSAQVVIRVSVFTVNFRRPRSVFELPDRT